MEHCKTCGNVIDAESPTAGNFGPAECQDCRDEREAFESEPEANERERIRRMIWDGKSAAGGTFERGE